jgi:HD-like signal output (HDOD) protein
MSGKYYPNNWEAWNDMPEDYLATPTWEEFEDWKLRGWELPSSVCCIIRAETDKGKVKEYVYQKAHAAENRIQQLIAEGATFTICTEDELRHISPVKSHESDQS